MNYALWFVLWQGSGNEIYSNNQSYRQNVAVMCARVNFFLDTEIHKYTERELSTDDDDDDCLFRDASVTLTVFFSPKSCFEL